MFGIQREYKFIKLIQIVSQTLDITSEILKMIHKNTSILYIQDTDWIKRHTEA
jgi:hypothetical protein